MGVGEVETKVETFRLDFFRFERLFFIRRRQLNVYISLPLVKIAKSKESSEYVFILLIRMFLYTISAILILLECEGN